MEDVFEAFIGALYLDFNELEITNSNMDFYSGLGFQVCQLFIINIIEKFVDFSDLILNDYNYKDQLLRYFQHTFQITPKYQMISQEGQSHERVFRMAVLDRDGQVLNVGEGRTKKKAEQEASKFTLIRFGVIEDCDN